jgi:hypothetical protein
MGGGQVPNLKKLYSAQRVQTITHCAKTPTRSQLPMAGRASFGNATYLKSGPFSSHEEYLSRITQPTYESSPSHLRPRFS